MPKKKADKGVSIQGYSRPIFHQNSKLLKQRGDDALYERWLKDHPGEKEVPDKVRQGLSNLKSVLRAKQKRHPDAAHREEPRHREGRGGVGPASPVRPLTIRFISGSAWGAWGLASRSAVGWSSWYPARPQV